MGFGPSTLEAAGLCPHLSRAPCQLDGNLRLWAKRPSIHVERGPPVVCPSVRVSAGAKGRSHLRGVPRHSTVSCLPLPLPLPLLVRADSAAGASRTREYTTQGPHPVPRRAAPRPRRGFARRRCSSTSAMGWDGTRHDVWHGCSAVQFPLTDAMPLSDCQFQHRSHREPPGRSDRCREAAACCDCERERERLRGSRLATRWTFHTGSSSIPRRRGLAVLSC